MEETRFGKGLEFGTVTRRRTKQTEEGEEAENERTRRKRRSSKGTRTRVWERKE